MNVLKSFNVPYVKGLKKAEFVKKFRHIYPKLDLEAIWETIRKAK